MVYPAAIASSSEILSMGLLVITPLLETDAVPRLSSTITGEFDEVLEKVEMLDAARVFEVSGGGVKVKQ